MSKTNPLKLHESKIVRVTEFFEGLENSSSTKSLCNSVENIIGSDRVTSSADRLGGISCLLIRRISLQALGKNTLVIIWSYDLKRVRM